jgi:hypothetical protein
VFHFLAPVLRFIALYRSSFIRADVYRGALGPSLPVEVGALKWE